MEEHSLSQRLFAETLGTAILVLVGPGSVVATLVLADSTLNVLVQQVNVNAEQELELFPAAGNHKVVLGNSEDLAVKFNKLKLFYTEGLNKTNSWQKYSTINLKYKNLVVCTKK